MPMIKGIRSNSMGIRFRIEFFLNLVNRYQSLSTGS